VRHRLFAIVTASSALMAAFALAAWTAALTVALARGGRIKPVLRLGAQESYAVELGIDGFFAEAVRPLPAPVLGPPAPVFVPPWMVARGTGGTVWCVARKTTLFIPFWLVAAAGGVQPLLWAMRSRTRRIRSVRL